MNFQENKIFYRLKIVIYIDWTIDIGGDTRIIPIVHYFC
jgi:hypothetical protein